MSAPYFFMIIFCRKARYEKLKSDKPKHEFNDTEYIRVREEILERTEDACEEGLLIDILEESCNLNAEFMKIKYP